MEQLILHACGHEQIHYLTGFTSQQDRKATWLRTTKCRTCFKAEKQAEQAAVATRDEAAIAHLDLQPLVGSARQVAWARTIRASRPCSLSRWTTAIVAGKLALPSSTLSGGSIIAH
jgi:hypothetical protein